MNTVPAEKEPAAKEIRIWGTEKLLEWIQKMLSVPLDSEDEEAFRRAKISGNVFLEGAGNRTFFEDAKLSFRFSVELAILAGKIIGRKSKCCGLHHSHHADSQLITL
jgi:hypothetical protein